tara:strand:- start:205 stop:615 length:411 start_codon:yes stop_codon:yes gene_type:complete
VTLARAAGFAFGFAFSLGLALAVDLDTAVFGFAGDFLDPVVVDLDDARFGLGEGDWAWVAFALVAVEVVFDLALGFALDRLVLVDEGSFGLETDLSGPEVFGLGESADFPTALGLKLISCLSILARISSSSIVPYP